MAASVKELLVFMAKSIVEHPESVDVSEIQQGEECVLELRVAKEDMGKVIGRNGRVAKDLRTIVRTAARDGRKVMVDIVE